MMKTVSLSAIPKKALFCNSKGVKWHFHMLSPSCGLSDSSRYAFVLETADSGMPFVHYSDKHEMDLRNQLLPFLHDKKVLDPNSVDTSHQSSAVVEKMVKRAKELNQKHIEWHHHMLFPDCYFNQRKPKWVLMFEDPEANETYQSLNDNEPLNDLKQIELLFEG